MRKTLTTMTIEPRDKILIVDDEADSLQTLQDILTSHGYDVVQARDGQEALDAIVKENPQLVIMDIIMPRVNGLEACAKMKSMYRYTPVILLTALEATGYKFKGLQVGADEFISKPFNSAELIIRINNLLEKRRLYEKLESTVKDVDALLSYSQDIMHQYQDERYAFIEGIAKLVDRYLYDVNTTKQWGHEYFIISSASSTRAYNRILWKEANTIKEMSALLPPAIINEIPANKLIYHGSLNSQLKAPLEAFIQHTTGRNFSFSNMYAYLESDIGIIALNASGVHQQLHAILFKEIVVLINFFKTISEKMKEVEDAFRYTILALARASEAHDDDTGNHIVRVGEFAKLLAEEYELDQKYIDQLHYSSQMHDVGKIMIPREILRKPGKLSDPEFETMKKHTLFGAKILGSAPRLAIAREVALYHHERFDGSGYPNGIMGQSIPISGRIVMLVDIYDALRSKRPYKPAFDHDRALNCIVKGDDRMNPAFFDPALLSIFKNKSLLFEEIFESFPDNNPKL